jgi:hypothetical protein
MTKIGGLTKETNHAVVVQDALKMEDFEAIATRIRVVRSSITAWRRKFNLALLRAEKHKENDLEDFGKRFELLATSLILNIVLSRLLCAIVPQCRALLEEEVQNLAAEIRDMESSVLHNQRAAFFFAQKAKVAEAALITHKYFQDVINSGQVVEAWRLNAFFVAMGRKCCDGVTCCFSINHT